MRDTIPTTTSLSTAGATTSRNTNEPAGGVCGENRRPHKIDAGTRETNLALTSVIAPTGWCNQPRGGGLRPMQVNR